MPRITKKQLEFIIGQMADTIIKTHQSFNKAQSELEKLDGKTRLKVIVEPREQVIESYYAKLRRHDD